MTLHAYNCPTRTLSGQCLGCATHPLFHVRVLQGEAQSEQVFVGFRDEQGNVRLDIPTPCTLLSVKPHGFPYCEVCDRGLSPLCVLLDDARIVAEVEAMDWPEVIGDS